MQVQNWLYQMANQYPDLAKVEDIGVSYRARVQTIIKVNEFIMTTYREIIEYIKKLNIRVNLC